MQEEVVEDLKERGGRGGGGGKGLVRGLVCKLPPKTTTIPLTHLPPLPFSLTLPNLGTYALSLAALASSPTGRTTGARRVRLARSAAPAVSITFLRKKTPIVPTASVPLPMHR